MPDRNLFSVGCRHIVMISLDILISYRNYVEFYTCQTFWRQVKFHLKKRSINSHSENISQPINNFYSDIKSFYIKFPKTEIWR